jgi:hypothetical protein
MRGAEAELERLALVGMLVQPSFGKSAVLNSVAPMRTTTGTCPQYSKPCASTLMSALSSSAMSRK